MFLPISVFGEECKFELDIALSDYDLKKVSCFNDYNSAKNKMNELEEKNLVIREGNTIIDAKYAIAVVSKGDNSSTINLYKDLNIKIIKK